LQVRGRSVACVITAPKASETFVTPSGWPVVRTADQGTIDTPHPFPKAKSEKQEKTKEKACQANLFADKKGDGGGKQAGAGDVNPDDTTGEKGGHHFLHTGADYKVIDAEKGNNERIEDRPDLRDG